MLALLDPSRQNIPEYAEYLGAIEREALRVNERFQRSGLDCRSICRSRTTSTSRSPPTSSTTPCS